MDHILGFFFKFIIMGFFYHSILWINHCKDSELSSSLEELTCFLRQFNYLMITLNLI